jgi:hypothetical protein
VSVIARRPAAEVPAIGPSRGDRFASLTADNATPGHVRNQLARLVGLVVGLDPAMTIGIAFCIIWGRL